MDHDQRKVWFESVAADVYEPLQRYLVSASEGSVNFCGFSGPATPELSALFDEAFAG